MYHYFGIITFEIQRILHVTEIWGALEAVAALRQIIPETDLTHVMFLTRMVMAIPNCFITVRREMVTYLTQNILVGICNCVCNRNSFWKISVGICNLIKHLITDMVTDFP